ncbi:RHS repeat-associated core domain-containing protein [Mycobacterium sp.]|uniref:RHS repeat-associated core domain-containing protein n=1 Tax=Mycobacterium sp. TaxID=1785 RepID=UPI003F98149F
MPVAETIAPDLPVLPLAACASVSENPHRGFPHPSTTLHQAIAFSKPLQPPGLPVCQYDFRRRSRCTGKERDAETGLDYFGARYFSSAQGRFTSPDWSAVPEPIPYGDLSDPQTLNLYSYVRNNPLSRADLDGHADPLQVLKHAFEVVSTTVSEGAAEASSKINLLAGGFAAGLLMITNAPSTGKDADLKPEQLTPEGSANKQRAENKQTRAETDDEERSADKDKKAQEPQASSSGATGQRGGGKDRSLTGTVDNIDSLNNAIDTGRQGKTSEINTNKKSKQNLDTKLNNVKNVQDAIDK